MANNSHGHHVYVKQIASNIVITYSVVAIPAPRCASGAHRKLSWVRLCHTLQSGYVEWDKLTRRPQDARREYLTPTQL